MKKIVSILLSGLFAISMLASCDQLKTQITNMIGNKAAEQQKKMDEMAAAIAQKLAEQQKQEEAAKAQMNAQIEAEVQRRLAEEKAKAETQPETQAQTQPITPPVAVVVPQEAIDKAAEKAVAKEEKKEKIVEDKAKQKEQADQKLKAIAEKLSGYARVYVDKNLSGRSMNLSFGHNVASTNGTAFKDNCSSVDYNIPSGWQFVLYSDSGYAGARYILRGSGSVRDLGHMNDKCSSFRWEKQ